MESSITKVTSSKSISGWHSLPGSLAFLGRRLAFTLLVLLVITYLAYLGIEAASGVPLSLALGISLRKSVAYLMHLLSGDLGASAGTFTLAPQPVSTLLPSLVANSLGLLAASTSFAAVLGVLLGLVAALRRRSVLSRLIVVFSITGVSLPSFFVAFLLQILAVRLTRTLGHRVLPVGGFGWDAHLILPALVLAARPVAQVARVTFISLSETFERDFVRTARSKGLRPATILTRHVLRNAAIPILTTTGLSLRFSLSSLPVVEFFFGWPGLGLALLRAIAGRDMGLTVALVLALGALFMLVNLLLDLLYRLIDPQLRRPAGRVGQGERHSLFAALTTLAADVRDALVGALAGLLLARRGENAGEKAVRALPMTAEAEALARQEMPGRRRRERLRLALTNVEFVAGTLVVLALLALVLFGARLAPYSPHATQGISFKGGVLSVPPFPPGAEHLWGTDVLGRDILSLVIAGAQQTLVVAAAVMVARLAIGTVLGLISGWLSDTWADRLLLGLAEIIAAFPALLLSMTLILAIGIRQGLRPFVIALCFVGWGEVMQFVRGEVMALRHRPFIEGAVATGLRPPRLLYSHVMPNVFPALISIAALEMGSVLMLLGELGFIGIFIGGGSAAEVVVDETFLFSDVPEWGALLSNVRDTARAYPWTAIYPALAFFVAILGFNLFGEGVRRLVDQTGINVSRLANRYTLAVAVVAVLGLGWARDNLGDIAYYRRQAATFSGESAIAHVQRLAGMSGRALGTSGLEAGAEYIAGQFQELGLQAAGEGFTYLQQLPRSFSTLETVPELLVAGDGPQPLYRQDYAEIAGTYNSPAQVEGQVRAIVMGTLTEAGGTWGSRGTFLPLRYADYSGEVVLLLSPDDIYKLWEVPTGGMLVVAPETDTMQHYYTLPPEDPFASYVFAKPPQPVFWVSQEMADRLLAGTGETVSSLRRRAESLANDEIVELATGVSVSMAIQTVTYSRTPVPQVIAHLPGASAQWDHRMIVVLAQYDSPPPLPGGPDIAAANDNASGVAVMLEVARAMQESGYAPYKTFLFVAYNGEGFGNQGPLTPPDVKAFLQAKQGFASGFEIEAIVDLRGLGAGDGNGLVITTGGNMQLARLFEESARQMGVKTRRASENVDLTAVFDDSSQPPAQSPTGLTVSWDGWAATAHTVADTLAAVSAEKLERAGRAITLALMKMGRDTSY